MAEESSANELEGLEKQLHSLLSRYSGDEFSADSEPFCSDFCKLVEEYTSRWQVPLPQLRILETALCCFARASTLFASNCDHVHHTISSLALSVFELLLFFDQKDFYQEPLKEFTATFQECHLVLAKYQNVHLLQVERLVQGGGPWASPALQAILSESNLPQNEVDGYVSSELPAFFELRVRYLLSCERASEAVALARCCVRHPIAGQNLFFLQVYLSWLYRTSQHEQLRKEVADINGKDAVHIICSLEREEKDELLLAVSTAFLSEQLHRGDVYYLCDLVLVWTNLHRRLSTSKQALLKECHKLMLSTANVKSIFPFIRAILQEVGEEAIQFCVELCANALQSSLPCDVITKSLIYKTIAGLLPNDLEVCRACALLVFFSERTVESYKMVYLLYMHPDQEYHVDDSPIGNNVRFETLQVLKKDLYFDPEFWNLIALRTNCLKLMSEKVVSAEIMEDKWISKYWSKEPALRSSRSACRRGNKSEFNAGAKKRHQKEDIDSASKRLKMGTGKMRLNDHAVRKKGQALKDTSSGPLRRSFWQLDRIHSNVALRYEEHRRTTRLSEKNPPKRRIRKPKWLLEDSGTLEENVPVKMKKNGLKQARHLRSCVMKRSETGPIKNNAKLKPLINSHLKARENDEHQNGFSEDFPLPASPPQIILELSLPDNELMGTFGEDACNRPRGFPQVLLYRPTVKLPDTYQTGKTVHRKEVVLRARDATMFIQQLHCYARRQKGKGNGQNVQGSVSTITRSSVQGSPPKDPQRELCEKTASEGKGGTISQTAAAARDKVSRISEKVLKAQNVKVLSRKTSSTRQPCEKSAVEMKVTSQRTGADKVTKSPNSSRIPQAKSPGKVAQSITCARDDSGNSSAELKDNAATEVPNLQEAPQPETVALSGEPCEESAVEMKVTIASQSPVLDKVSKAQVSQTTAAVKTKKKATGETHPVSINANVSYSRAADSIPSHSQDVALRGGEQELKSLPSQGESGKNCNTVRNHISTMDVTEVSPKNSKGHVPCDNDTSPTRNVTQSKPSEAETSYNPTEQASLNDISSLTLVTEMITELAPEQLAQDQENDKRQSSDNGASKDFRGANEPKGPHKIRTTSSSSTSEEEASSVNVQGMEEAPDDNSDTPENSELLEMTPESEESKLEYSCTFCNKVFKGSRVVAHAMFHFRKDECMFCRIMFKDDLLAMMHLSDHIEKLKRIKEPQTGNKALEQEASDTKDTSTPKTSAKANATSMISGCRSKGRLRKSSVCSKTSLPDLSPLESRTLRSKDRQVIGTSLHEKQNPAKDPNDKTAVHRVNGHIIGKKKEPSELKKDFDTKQEIGLQEISQQRKKHGAMSSNLPENQDIEINSSASPVQTGLGFVCSKKDKKKKTESEQALKTASKQNGNVAEEKNVEPHEKVCCPVDGCAWVTDLSRNRVALLYHALDEHYGELKPLELAFQVGNNKCSICMRVLWSFEHFQHHVERHRLAPRHPCLHQGCTARFKTGIEMRRHSRRHSPLQAMCCLPGCSQLFICLWALNLHERDHYASKSVKLDKNTNVQTSDKPCKTEDTTVPTTGSRTVNVKAACKLREQASHDLKLRKNVAAPLSASTSIAKKELKDRKASKDSHLLKNVSYQETSSRRAFPNLRLRRTLRKVPVKNPTLAAHKVISSSLLKHSRKVKHKLEKRQLKGNTKGLKRKGRPKLNKSAHDENTTAGHKLSTSETVTISTTSNKLKVEKEKNPQGQDEIITTNKSLDGTETKILEGKQITRNRVHPPSSLKKTTSEVKTQKRDVVRIKKLQKITNHHTPSDCSKSNKHKSSKSKTNKRAVQKKCNKQEDGFPSAEKKPATSAVPQVEAEVAATESSDKGKAKLDDTSSTQIDSGNSAPSVPAEESNMPPTTENMQKVKKGGKSKKSLIAKEGNDQHILSSNSRKAKKASKELDKKVNKRFAKEKHPCKNQGKGKTSTSEKMAKSKFDVQRRNEAKGKSTVEEGRGNEEASDAKVHSSATSKPADILICPSTTPEENKQETHKKEKSKKSEVTNKLDASKTSKKRKDVHKADTKTTFKKKCKDHQSSTKKSVKSTKVQQASEKSSADTEAKAPAEMPPSMTSGSSQAVNGQEPIEDVKSAASKESQVDYRKRPYMRPPPTAYLDEKFITMPKRRKEMAFSLPCHWSAPPPGPACGTAALQRRRCAKCFATFSSAEELQSHVQLQKCSNLFGFDSDDEGNS
ncbi:uncharacterized protein PAE49_012509 [Odontesthes bonariensis]|uniref:uncharacterized protein LOC142391725 n=1 Tax=Odontesthes bonariensis TaxID=219752 RepID=UPI003F5818B8